MPSNTLLKQWDPSSSFKILESDFCIILSALRINFYELSIENTPLFTVYQPMLVQKNFGCILVLKWWNLCIRVCIGFNRALSSESWFEILVQKNFGWNLCIHVCIGRNRGGGSPFQVKFTKISYPRLCFQYTTFPSLCKNEEKYSWWNMRNTIEKN